MRRRRQRAATTSVTGIVNPPKDRILQGVLFVCIAMALFSALNATVKSMGGEYPVGQLIWSRYVFALIVMVILFFPRHRWGLFQPKHLGIQLLRGALLFGSSALYFQGLLGLPLPTAATLSMCAPLLVTALSVPFLGEPVGPRRWAAVAVGFVGGLIVIRPGADGINPFMLFGLASMCCGTFYVLLTRKYAGEENAEVSATIATVVGTVGGAVWTAMEYRPPAVAFDGMLMVSLGIYAAVGHWLYTMAFQRGPASVIAPFSYTQIVGATLFGFILFGTFPDEMTWLGAAIIIASGLYIAHREHVRSKPKTSITGN